MNPCCPDFPLCPAPTEPVAREAWHLAQERLERAWLDEHIRQQLTAPASKPGFEPHPATPAAATLKTRF